MANASLKLSWARLMTTATNPNHYKTDDGIECVDAIRAMLGQERFEGFCQGNILKYVLALQQKKAAKKIWKRPRSIWAGLIDSVQ